MLARERAPRARAPTPTRCFARWPRADVARRALAALRRRRRARRGALPRELAPAALATLLPPATLAATLLHVMLEGRVALVSRALSVVAAAAACTRALLQPLSWHHLYYPLLPQSALAMLEAPCPFLFGVARGARGASLDAPVRLVAGDRAARGQGHRRIPAAAAAPASAHSPTEMFHKAAAAAANGGADGGLALAGAPSAVVVVVDLDRAGGALEATALARCALARRLATALAGVATPFVFDADAPGDEPNDGARSSPLDLAERAEPSSARLCASRCAAAPSCAAGRCR